MRLAGAGVQVDAVAADAHAVGKLLGLILPLPRLHAHVVLGHGELRLDAPALADVGRFGQPILRPRPGRGAGAGRGSPARRPGAALRSAASRAGSAMSWRDSSRRLLDLLFRLVDDVPSPVIVLRPVDQGDVLGHSARRGSGPCRRCAGTATARRTWSALSSGNRQRFQRLQRLRAPGRSQSSSCRARPGSSRGVILPEFVLGRLSR